MLANGGEAELKGFHETVRLYEVRLWEGLSPSPAR